MSRPRSSADVMTRRLRAQRLIGAPFTSAVEAVRWFGAMQAQDPAGARWALGLRVRGATDAGVRSLLDRGVILRTHVLRPTWHFVAPDDIRWLLDLTGPRVRRGLAGRYLRLEIDEKQMTRAVTVIARAVAGRRYMTRAQIGDVLRRARIAPDGQRLPHFIMGAELLGIIASGPQRGRDVTYGLLDELAPRARRLTRDEALAEIALRYFRAHGPARLHDLAWWSGLTLADARDSIALAGGALVPETVDDVPHWSHPDSSSTRARANVAHLLPNFDELTVGYSERGDLVDARYPMDPSLFAFGSVLANIVTVGGRVRGAWRRTVSRDGTRIAVRPLGPMSRPEREMVDRAAARMSRFLERDVHVDWA